MNETPTTNIKPPDMPSETDISTANWQHRVLKPDDETASLSRLEPEQSSPNQPSQLPKFNLKLERTPVEFAHLYAALERQVAGMGDMTLLSGETLGGDRPYVLGVTSSVSGEGKTTTALHLAMTVARNTFKRVCLIDMSLGKGDLSTRLGAPPSKHGMVAALEGHEEIVPTLQLSGCDNLVIIPAGKSPINAAKLARSPRVAQMLISARHSFDVVIVDLPAVSSDNALPLVRHVDGIMVVTRSSATPSHVVSRALDILGRDKVVGVVLNRNQPSMPMWLHKRFVKA